MGLLLMVVGYGWALLGLANIVTHPGWATGSSETSIAISIIINAVLFILPGLVVGAMGGLLRKKASH